MKWDKYSNPRPDSESSGSTRTTTRRRYDPDVCPGWAEESIWNLMLYFEQLATKAGFQLKAGRPVLYSLLDDRVTKFGLRDRLPKYWLDSKGHCRTWDECVKAAIHEYWTLNYATEAAEWAADDFCGPIRFNEMVQKVRERAMNHRIVARAKAERDQAGG